MDKKTKIYVAGHNGLVGSAVCRMLKKFGYTNVVTRSRKELDLLDQQGTFSFLMQERPDVIIDCAAKVGGIKANMTYPANFLYDNLQIQNNLIWGAKEANVKKFVFLGSSCIYPRDCPQPMKEEYFMTGRPEPTNEGYAYAKIAGMKLCEYIHTQYKMGFISCMPTNIYGPGDNFNPETSHVIPSLLRRIHEAKEQSLPEVVIWGTGTSRREFLHVDDLAEAIVWLMENYDDTDFTNIGTGSDISIKELALKIKALVNYEGKLVFDSSKPDGMPKKLLDVTRIHDAGWHHKIEFDEGLKSTYNWYLKNVADK